jgi:cysteine desulfurase
LPELYFDHNATTPLCGAARDAWLATSDRFWHNPSSLYPPAGAAKRRLEDAREALADLLGIDDPERIVFTSGATEANNATIVACAADPRSTALASPIEHPSVLAPVRRHFDGRWHEAPLEPDALGAAIRESGAGIVAIMAANNETGALLPVPDLAAAAREAAAVFLCDATQAFGKLDLREIDSWGDVVVGSAHKFGGPKGVGFALLNKGTELRLQTGGPQEMGHRAGTEDLAGIAAMVAALEDADLPSTSAEAAHRDAFERTIASRLPGTRPVGAEAPRLPNTSMLILPAERNLKWLTRLGRVGVCVSTGSACSSGAESGSHVLQAMGIPHDEIDRAVRVSSGPDTSEAEWDALADAFSGVWEDFADRSGDRKPSLDLGSL